MQKSFRVSHARVYLKEKANNRNCSELNLDYYHLLPKHDH